MTRRERRRDPFRDGPQNPVTLVEQAAVDLFYDYDQLPEAIRDPVRRSAITIKPRLKRAAEDIFVIGQELQAVKDRLPHGSYTDWLDVEFGLSERMAQRFVGVSERLGGKSDKLSLLPPSTLYLLAAPSTPDEAIQTVERKLDAGERIRVAMVRQAIEEAKRQSVPASQMIIDGTVLEREIADVRSADTVEVERRATAVGLDQLLSQVVRMLEGGPVKDWALLLHNDALGDVRRELIRLRGELRSQVLNPQPPFDTDDAT